MLPALPWGHRRQGGLLGAPGAGSYEAGPKDLGRTVRKNHVQGLQRGLGPCVAQALHLIPPVGAQSGPAATQQLVAGCGSSSSA